MNMIWENWEARKNGQYKPRCVGGGRPGGVGDETAQRQREEQWTTPNRRGRAAESSHRGDGRRDVWDGGRRPRAAALGMQGRAWFRSSFASGEGVLVLCGGVGGAGGAACRMQGGRRRGLGRGAGLPATGTDLGRGAGRRRLGSWGMEGSGRPVKFLAKSQLVLFPCPTSFLTIYI